MTRESRWTPVASTPHLYVSDPNNHRVLGFADARKVGPGVPADLVIGEPDLRPASAILAASQTHPPKQTRRPGSPPNPAFAIPRDWRWIQPPATSSWPTLIMGACCDSRRPLRQEPPARRPIWCWAKPDSRGFRIRKPASPSWRFLTAWFSTRSADCWSPIEGANRVLLFPMTNPTNGEPASTVIGQPNFAGTSTTVLSPPHHIAEDTIAEVYVADAGHNQILVFNIPSGTSTHHAGQCLYRAELPGSRLGEPEHRGRLPQRYLGRRSYRPFPVSDAQPVGNRTLPTLDHAGGGSGGTISQACSGEAFANIRP